jgi:hypothetical protein
MVATALVAFVGILAFAALLSVFTGDDKPSTSTATGRPPMTVRSPTTVRLPTTVRSTQPPEPTQHEPDASARAACEHFRNVMGDVAAGILTDAELRGKFREVHRSASVSDEPGLAQAGTKLLAAMTTGTTEDLLEAAGRFDRECDQAGL